MPRPPRCTIRAASALNLLTAFARARLHAALAGPRPLHQHPRAVFACVPGELHEIMLMLLALDVGLEAVRTLNLGSDTPVEAIVHAGPRLGRARARGSSTSDARCRRLIRPRRRSNWCTHSSRDDGRFLAPRETRSAGLTLVRAD